MSEPLVSIIVPVFKVEPYLRRCLDSIVNQTYRNTEIILVDDGSPDGCPQICDEYAAKDNRIVVIHKENGGLSDARNAGINICRGEYISFVDGDDWIDSTYIEILLDLIQKENADISITNHQEFYDENRTIPAYPLENRTYCGRDALRKLILFPSIHFILSWGKLYKRKLFDELRFPKGKIHEDQYTSYILLFLSQRIACKDVITYHYQKRPDSIMGSLSTFDYTPIEEEQAAFFRKHNIDDLSFFLYNRLYWRCLKNYCNAKKDNGKERAICSKSKLRYYLDEITIIKQKPAIMFKTMQFLTAFPILYYCYNRWMNHIRDSISFFISSKSK